MEPLDQLYELSAKASSYEQMLRVLTQGE